LTRQESIVQFDDQQGKKIHPAVIAAEHDLAAFDVDFANKGHMPVGSRSASCLAASSPTARRTIIVSQRSASPQAPWSS
jgi:hypothetical protein